MPGDDPEHGFAIALLNGNGGVSDERTVTAPGFDLRLINDDMRSVAVDDSGPRGWSDGSSGGGRQCLERFDREGPEDKR
jgi:hypothetical protein